MIMGVNTRHVVRDRTKQPNVGFESRTKPSIQVCLKLETSNHNFNVVHPTAALVTEFQPQVLNFPCSSSDKSRSRGCLTRSIQMYRCVDMALCLLGSSNVPSHVWGHDSYPEGWEPCQLNHASKSISAQSNIQNPSFRSKQPLRDPRRAYLAIAIMRVN